MEFSSLVDHYLCFVHLSVKSKFSLFLNGKTSCLALSDFLVNYFIFLTIFFLFKKSQQKRSENKMKKKFRFKKPNQNKESLKEKRRNFLKIDVLLRPTADWKLAENND